jgi:two-component system chemotaxis response regulator CheB
MASNKTAIKAALAPIIAAFARSGRRLPVRPAGRPAAAKKPLPARTAPAAPAKTRSFTGGRRNRSEIIAIGISTGGPNALAHMLPHLPGDIGVPIVIVQHMPPVFTQSLANSLDKKCALNVREATNGEPLKANTVYIAPGGKQMKIVAGGDGRTRLVKITNDPPENSCKPSVDYLFRSVADHYVGRATGVIMTGMGSDGTKGLVQMKRNGAFVIAQDQQSCVVYGMPKEPTESGIVDVVAPLTRIADEIGKTLK